ncbi:MAG: DUF805 domain-containing protein, partial [Pseudomonadota bacterium]|nr:DUF805 domain-containing protein [Pseudomonadota bacterium]
MTPLETDRFAPPLAQVTDIETAYDGFQPIRLWPPSGRIGRLRLMAYSLGLYAAFIGVSMVIGLLGGAAGAIAGKSAGSTAIGVLGVIAFIGYLAAGISLIVQRSHDMDISGWWSILSFVPLAFLFWLFNPGSRGANRWGAP